MRMRPKITDFLLEFAVRESDLRKRTPIDRD